MVFDHLQFNGFAGGYIGVDVFFVISGYLIGSSLIAEFGRGKFSLLAFYERRIRRIFPALLAMLLVVSALAYHYLMPTALVGYAGSLMAALLSFSNFLFWHQSGYFDTTSAAKPLLHTWSLAVEEQFYVFFPLLLFCVFRWVPNKLRAILWTVAAITFALSVWVVRFDSPTAFFWSPLRAWELMAGVLISQYGFAAFSTRGLREVVALLGLVLILVPGFRYTAQTPFPGWTALLPVLGAALIIAAGQVGGSVVGTLLGLPPVRFIGLISYSLYLWHWPILVLQNTGLMVSNRPSMERNTKLTLLVISLVVATLSWWLVELPFRKGRFKPSRTPLFLLNGAVAAVIAIAAFGMVQAKGMPSRFPDEIVRVANFADYDVTQPWRQGTCFLTPENSFKDFKPDTCLDRVAGKKQYLLFGDSTVAQLYSGLVATFPEIHFQQATSSACRPYADLSELKSEYERNCHALWQYVHTTYLPSQHPDAVILGSVWGQPALANLGPEIKSFQDLGIPVILLGPVMDFDMPLPLLLSVEMERRDSERVRSVNLTGHLRKTEEPFDATMGRMAREQWHVRYISYFKNLCGQQVEQMAKEQWETTTGCPLFTNAGEPLLFDNRHFTSTGALLFASAVRTKAQLP